MEIKVEKRGNTFIFYLEGDFVTVDIPYIDKIWDEQIAKNPEIIALNFHKVVCLDSSAIGTLVKFFKHAKKNGVTLIFYALNKVINNLFEITKLNNYFTVISKEKFDKDFINNNF